MRASQNNMLFKTITAIYYISWIFIGNFILLNLFLAILIDSFGEVETQVEDEESSRRGDIQAFILHRKLLFMLLPSAESPIRICILLCKT